jgi:hypothetical protein
MTRYLAFFVVGCVFTVGVVGMVETHRQMPSPMPQFMAYQGAH